ncbi:permease for cytosine/purines, uracil, thiamine, allantoin-domain-containing protein [Alternaria rosae]|uniref:permease for cytosine/purines, uracil, thiamine, allantoin-domain-containing protein n=1 Tax=Alternaria rosae TaxID=1187941 RepID=UPI001E8D3BFE|nr:permease for cytosine/purines, uracil, thiamine, allantoin-domain-containing protein [Alternaria rosae]KAH6842166.1 permease for cytosine/purines, uracil, thiamine, allantoin-domain-containing protein [Alternaria rosae]
MSRLLQQGKDVLRSPKTLKEIAQTTSDQGEVRYNKDLLPSPPEDRRWRWQHYFAYYLTMTFSPSSYNLGASLVSIGLLWWHGMIAAIIGSAILTVLVVLNSRGAIKYFLGFPVYVRAAAGVRGASLYILVRAVVAIIYFATQTYYGGRITSVFMRGIFGNGYNDIPNRLPESAGITSRDLLSFFLFWMAQLPVMFIHPTVLRHLFVIKAVYTTIALFGVLAWVISANGGKIGSFTYTTKQTQLSGSALIWPMIQAINSVMGALAPVLINQPDIARYGHSYGDVTWSQGFGILTSKVLVMFLSTATTAAATQVLGKSYWNVWDLYDAILDQYWTAGARAGIVFASFGMMLAVLVTNAGSNSLPVGADLTGIFPRWLTIVRGQVLCAILAPLLVPWKIIASATAFLTFLGSYTVFLMPICACMIVDYWLVRKGNLHVPSLYTAASESPYSYYKGWNMRMLAAWTAGVAFTVHGVAGSLDADSVAEASKNMYKLGFLLSLFMGGLVYYSLCLIWPVKMVPRGAGRELGFEALAANEGFFDDENIGTITGVLEGEEVHGTQHGAADSKESKV